MITLCCRVFAGRYTGDFGLPFAWTLRRSFTQKRGGDGQKVREYPSCTQKHDLHDNGCIIHDNAFVRRAVRRAHAIR